LRALRASAVHTRGLPCGCTPSCVVGGAVESGGVGAVARAVRHGGCRRASRFPPPPPLWSLGRWPSAGARAAHFPLASPAVASTLQGLARTASACRELPADEWRGCCPLTLSLTPPPPNPPTHSLAAPPRHHSSTTHSWITTASVWPLPPATGRSRCLTCRARSTCRWRTCRGERPHTRFCARFWGSAVST
jgi:hypothetical protein